MNSNEEVKDSVKKLAKEHAEKANDIYVKEHPFPNQVPDDMQIRLMDMFKVQELTVRHHTIR